MYLRDSRAIDYIATRPDWDGKTIVIMGTSMGGQQSLVTAGLNPKVTAVLVNEPSGADSNSRSARGHPMIESDHNNITPQKQGAWDSRWKEVLGIILKGGTFTPNQEWTRK
jgi:dienelactone hydrolase